MGKELILEVDVAPAVEEVISETKGQAGGLAPLGSDGKVPDAQLPARLGETALNATIEGVAGEKLTYKGVYISADVFKPNDLVQRLGGVYRAKEETSADPVLEPSKWEYFAFGWTPQEAEERITEAVEPLVTRTGRRAVGQGEIVYNFADYAAARGLDPNGATVSNLNVDYTDALLDIVAALPLVPNGGTAVVSFPPGQFNFRGGVDYFPAGRTVHVRGSGINQTELRFVSGSGTTGDLITLNGQLSSISDLTLNGRVSVTPNAGDLLVLNGPRQSINRVRAIDSKGNGVSIGKGAGAIGWRIYDLLAKNNRGYGVRVFGDYVSTDGIWLGGDIGQSGLSGCRLDATSQNITLLHIWGAGMHSNTDNHGLLINARGQVILGLQSETNMGCGVYIDGTIDGSYIELNGGRVWGNMRQGVQIVSATHVGLNGVGIERNGVGNTGINSGAYSGIHNAGSTDISVIGCQIWDNGAAIAAIDPPSGALFSYPGRPSSTVTQAYHYSESAGGTDRIVFVGNKARAELCRSTLQPLLVNSPTFLNAANDLGNQTRPSVASAAQITLPRWGDIIRISGTTTITSIAAGGVGSGKITLQFEGASHLAMQAGTPTSIAAGGSGMKISGNFTPDQYGSITLAWDPTRAIWFEVSRSV